MSLPPTTIHIKRKATDEPVDFLRVHESNGKRQRRATDFVFSRQPSDNDSTPPSPAHQSIRRIKQLPRVGSSPALGAQSHQETNLKDAKQLNPPVGAKVPDPATSPPIPTNSYEPLSQVAQVRRFHISRTSTPTRSQSPVIGSKVSKPQPTVFVECRSRAAPPRVGTPISPRESVALTPEPEPIRLQKKPGLAARISAESHVNTPTVPNPSPLAGNNRLPSGLTMPWNLDDEQLAAEMQAYTLQEIGRSMAESEATHPTIISTETVDTHLRRKQSKFKPKAPALRYQERHPEEVIQKSEVEIDELSDHDMDGDVEYVIDTYIRMPAEALDGEANVGELVINDKDVEGFYTEDLDHEEEVDDEEDENAEDHYTADYPEDEVDSDDEYGRNVYQYQNRNSSDNEEFDENAYSDDDATRYPWTKKPAWLKNGGDNDEEHDSDDSDYVQ